MNRDHSRHVGEGVSPAPLSALDAAFLSLESDQAPMHVGWAALFDPPRDGKRPRFADVREHISRRLGRAPRYRQKLAAIPLGLGEPVWVDDPGFDIADHVLRAAHRDFGTLVDEVMSAPLEHDRPLWELWIAEDLEGGQIGVVGKAHHCLVDGLAAVELMALLLDATPQADVGSGDGWTARVPPSTLALARDALGHRIDEALGLARLPLSWAREPATLRELPAQAWRMARAAAHTASPPALPSRLNGDMSALRHLACHSRPLEDLKVIKRRFGTTINDVLLSASAGALRDLAADRSEAPRTVKAMVPVSVQAPDERWGNRIAFLFLGLPCDEPDPVWRLRDVHVAMRDRKREGEPEGADALLNVVSHAPRAVRLMASKIISSPQLSNLTISNIPGPQIPLYLMGCEVREAYPVVPLTHGHGISIGMTTIHERACFGVYAQADLTDDADRLARGIDRSIGELLERAAA
jgi:WS/DGAT/MGAT family acyltransferase